MPQKNQGPVQGTNPSPAMPYPISDTVRKALQQEFPSLRDEELRHLNEKMPLAGGLDRDDAATLLDLMQRKLIETEIEIRKKGVAVGHEFISDAPSFALAGVAIPAYLMHFNEASSHLLQDLNFFSASAAGLVLLHRFIKKEVQILDEFMQVYNIWKPYIETRKEANRIRREALQIDSPDDQIEKFREAILMKDAGLRDLRARFRGSGLLFEGIKIPKDYESRLSNGFYFDDAKVDAIASDVQANLAARGTILKELLYRGGMVAGFVKQAPRTMLTQAWNKVKNVGADVWDNTLKIHKTFARVCAGPKYVWKPDISYRRHLDNLIKEGPVHGSRDDYQAARADLINHLQQAKEDASTYCIASVFGGAHAILLPLECWVFINEAAQLASGTAGDQGVTTALAALGTAFVSYFSLMVFADPLRQTVDNLERNLGEDGVLKGKIARYIEVREGLGNAKQVAPPAKAQILPPPEDDLHP